MDLEGDLHDDERLREVLRLGGGEGDAGVGLVVDGDRDGAPVGADGRGGRVGCHRRFARGVVPPLARDSPRRLVVRRAEGRAPAVEPASPEREAAGAAPPRAITTEARGRAQG